MMAGNKVYAIVIPVQNEAPIIGDTLRELEQRLPAGAMIAVGLNNCTDHSREVCEEFPDVIIGETDRSGYGWGCQAAIDAIDQVAEPTAYLFFAGDGANHPEDLEKLIETFEKGGTNFVIGLRKFELSDWVSEFGRALPNLILGVACSALGGQFFHDLGPTRLIERKLFHRMQLQEMVWGWTIEAQLRAAQLGESIVPIKITERPRQGGEQKVSGISLRRSLFIGWEILKAAWRTSRSDLKQQKSD